MGGLEPKRLKDSYLTPEVAPARIFVVGNRMRERLHYRASGTPSLVRAGTKFTKAGKNRKCSKASFWVLCSRC